MSGFVRVPGSSPPQFTEVPELVVAPLGPYRKAPVEYGGNFWLVSPFTGEEPWLTQGRPVAEPPYPDGFIEMFGPRPQGRDFVGGAVTLREALVRWEQDLKYFKRAGYPDGYNAEQIETASKVFVAWGLGAPKFYEGRYGFMARFPDSAFRTFEAPTVAVVVAAHLVIAQYQVELAAAGMTPERWHPFVPPYIRGD